MDFPANWDQGCPPSDALSCDNEVYHVVKDNPIPPGSIKSFIEQGKVMKGKGPSCSCMKFGISVYNNVSDAEWTLKAYPRLGKFIAKGRLASEDGVLKATPNDNTASHMTWWPYNQCNRESKFAVILGAL